MKRLALLAAMSPLLGVMLVNGCSSSNESCGILPGITESADAGDAADGDVVNTSCNAEVVVGLYGDDKCTAGTEVLKVTFSIAEPCVGWSRSTGSDTVYNSASRFQCFRDRLCYTQYVHSCACNADQAQKVEDKESCVTCQKDPTPGIWTRVLSGTENCPDAPTGFVCPASSSGNTEIMGACSK